MTQALQTEAITIVLPVYGRSALLAQALASVLGQSDPGWRLLIADDHSPPDTVAQLQAWEQGPAAGRSVACTSSAPCVRWKRQSRVST